MHSLKKSKWSFDTFWEHLISINFFPKKQTRPHSFNDPEYTNAGKRNQKWNKKKVIYRVTEFERLIHQFSYLENRKFKFQVKRKRFEEIKEK